MNHPQKRAKYYIQTENSTKSDYKLCSKCAVTLADQGTKIKELCNNQDEQRRAEIDAFLIKLGHSKHKSADLVKAISNKKLNIEEHYKKQCTKAEDVAATLEQVIQEQLTQIKQVFAEQKEQLLHQIDGLEQYFQAGVTEIEDMRGDIERNVNNILKHIGHQPFQKIIGKYYERLHEMDVELDSTRTQKVTAVKLAAVKPNHFEDLKTAIAGFLELVPCNSLLVKRYEHPSSNSASPFSSCKQSPDASFENQQQRHDKNTETVFKAQNDGDRFSFACDQSAILKAWRQKEDQIQSERASDRLDFGAGAMNLKLATWGEKENESSCFPGSYQVEHSSVNRASFQRSQAGHSRHGSCPSIKSVPLNAAIIGVEPNEQELEDSIAYNRDSFSKYAATIAAESNKTSDYKPPIVNHFALDEEGLSSYSNLSKSLGEAPKKASTRALFMDEEEETKTQPSTKVKKLHYNPFSRRKEQQKASNKRYSKSQENALRYIDDDVIVQEQKESETSSPYQSTYCSPNFKDNIEQ